MSGKEEFKKLGYKEYISKVPMFIGNYIEYVKKEKDGNMTISLIEENKTKTRSIMIRKYLLKNNKEVGEIPEAIYIDELKALYKTIYDLGWLNDDEN